MKRCAEPSQVGEERAMKNAAVATAVQMVAARFGGAQGFGHSIRYHAQTSARATTIRMKPRYAMKGPSMVSHEPPSPMIESPMGKTQQEAVSSAKNAAKGMTNHTGSRVFVAVS